MRRGSPSDPGCVSVPESSSDQCSKCSPWGTRPQMVGGSTSTRSPHPGLGERTQLRLSVLGLSDCLANLMARNTKPAIADRKTSARRPRRNMRRRLVEGGRRGRVVRLRHRAGCPASGTADVRGFRELVWARNHPAAGPRGPHRRGRRLLSVGSRAFRRTRLDCHRQARSWSGVRWHRDLARVPRSDG